MTTKAATFAGVALAFMVAAATAPAAPPPDKDKKLEVARVLTEVSDPMPVGAADLLSGVPAGADVETTGTAPNDVRLAQVVGLAGCWWARVRRWGENIFGTDLWAYYQRIDWCANSSAITWKSRTRWGETYIPGWSYRGHIGSVQNGGVGSTFYRSWTQGHFCFISYFGCVQDRYPWIDMTVRRFGNWSWDAGG